jgi:fructan beta-fructosidase
MVVVFALSPAFARGQVRKDILIADFEGDTYGAWRTTGQAFGPGPAKGTLPGQMPVSGYQGKGLVNSFYGGDASTGTLTSPPLTVQRKYVNFLIGGGKHPGETCINLLVDGKVVRTATGPNDRPGGSEQLDWHTWDVSDLAGKKVVIEIVDRHSGGWGHINIDHIVQSDRRAAPSPEDLRRQITVLQPYLLLPVKNKARRRHMRFTVQGKIVREFEIKLAEAEPDFWVFSDVAAFKGKQLRIDVDSLTVESKGLASIRQSATVPEADNLYKEKLRPQFHFSSRRGWNNDPNGLVYFRGEYHLFYQHNPYGWDWGNMHWGHALSKDLVHWRELPIALYPRRFGDWVFSGSAAVDWHNTSGFGVGPEPPLVAAFTSTGRGECIAFSNDKGRTFTEYQDNPVVKHQGRDPKILWYTPGRHWVMAVYDEHQGKQWIAFYTSPNLKDWAYQSRIEGFYECPELFELPVDGDSGKKKWVIHAADGNYALGTFDGKRFTKESGKHRGNYGNCLYAAQTFSDIPKEDGRRIQIGWGRISTPGMPFNQMMLFPCELTLGTTQDGLRLFARPVREIASLHAGQHQWRNHLLREKDNPLATLKGELFEIRAEFAVDRSDTFGFVLRGIPVIYDVRKQQVSSGGNTALLKPVDGKLRLQILVDRTSIEIYGNDGRIYMPIGIIPADANRSLEVFTRGGPTRVHSLDVYPLRSAWLPAK